MAALAIDALPSNRSVVSSPHASFAAPVLPSACRYPLTPVVAINARVVAPTPSHERDRGLIFRPPARPRRQLSDVRIRAALQSGGKKVGVYHAMSTALFR